MSSLIELAAEFFDRMANPVFGAHVNDEYALRFASLVRDSAVAERLDVEAGRLQSVDALSAYGWTWLLGWARTRNLRLDVELLLDLCERWDSAAFKASVINAALTQYSGSETRSTLDGIPDPWLQRLLLRAVEREPIGDSDEPLVSPSQLTPARNLHAQSLLIALLLVERDVTLDAASALLRHEWDGRDALLEFFWSRVDDLDPGTSARWQSRLEPRGRPEPTAR
jgi:hypothetical protein